jgi:hypothetical protein
MRSPEANFLETVFSKYYEPEKWNKEIDFRKLSEDSSKVNGMDGLYLKDGSSRGKYEEKLALKNYDTYEILSTAG